MRFRSKLTLIGGLADTGAGASQSRECVISVDSPVATTAGGGASFCPMSKIDAVNCTAPAGGAIYNSNSTTLSVQGSTATDSNDGVVSLSNEIVGIGHWVGNSTPVIKAAAGYKWMGRFAVDNVAISQETWSEADL